MQKVKVKGKVTEVKTLLSPFPDCNSSLNSYMMMKWCKKLDVAKEGCPIVFQCHPSNFKVTQLKNLFFTQTGHFRTVTSVWIHHWLQNDGQSLKRCPILLQDHPSNFKFTRDKKIADFDPNWAFPDCNSSFNTPMVLKWCTKLHPSHFEVKRAENRRFESSYRSYQIPQICLVQIIPGDTKLMAAILCVNGDAWC